MFKNDQMFGKFRIGKTLGEGGAGIVYLALDTENNRTVALKVLSEELADNLRFREELKAEAKLTASIDSPGVVKIFEQSEIDGQTYISMELVPGIDLRDGLSGQTLDQKLRLAVQIGQAIFAAHEVGLIHRDLKPENIKLDESGNPRILDFGLAQSVDTEKVDESGEVAGTLYYLSPEQVAVEPLTAKSDLFSFGTILYELIVGRRPFEGDYSAAIIYAILHEDPARPSEVNEELPGWIDSLLLRLLAKRPDDRFASAEAAVKFMEAGLSGSDDDMISPAGRARYSVAVVDLKNLSGDDDWSYFCEGFTDSVMRELIRRSDLIVTGEPTTSQELTIAEMFARCRTDFLLVGSLGKQAEKIELKLSVYGKQSDDPVWSECFVEETDSLFTLLSRVAEAASEVLADRTSSEAIAVQDQFQADVSAYDLYLKGCNYYRTNKEDDLVLAEESFKSAIKIDPQLALAHTGLSDVYAFQYMAYYDRTAAKIAASRAEAEKALELEPSLPEAHRSLARYHMFTADAASAEGSLLKATELNPKYAVGYRTLGWLKRSSGEFDEATRYARQALDLAPTDLETLLLLSLISMDQGKLTLAMATLRRAVELSEDYGRAYYALGQIYQKLGVLDASLENLDLAIKYSGDPNAHIDSGFVLLVQQNYELARERFAEAIATGHFPFIAEYYLGITALVSYDTLDAWGHFAKALELVSALSPEETGNIHVMAYQALAMVGGGDFEGARTLVEAIEVQENLDGELLYNLARAYAMLGEKEKADQLLEKAKSAMSGPTEKQIEADPHFTLDLS
ncbi:MAG: protein kinase [candidate division Zixibacteria bacterium]